MHEENAIEKSILLLLLVRLSRINNKLINNDKKDKLRMFSLYTFILFIIAKYFTKCNIIKFFSYNMKMDVLHRTKWEMFL